MPAGSRYRATPNIPGLEPETVRALQAEFKRIADEQFRLSNPNVVLPAQSGRIMAAAGQTLRIAPPPDGALLSLPTPVPANMGPGNAITVFIEAVEGTLTVQAVPSAEVRNPTVNGAEQLIYETAGLVRFYSNGVDRWSTTNEIPIAVSRTGVQTPGAVGATGATGATGAQGERGDQGIPGLMGLPGDQGIPGAPGQRGEQGEQGLGIPGLAGFDGTPGAPGVPGVPGPIGPAGIPGMMGTDGLGGAPGPAGPQGPSGSSGAGSPGIPGLAGFDGLVGAPGSPGVAGATGPTGPTGPAGSAGSGLIASVDVNLGTVPLWSGSFTISGLSGLTPGDPVLVTRGIGAGGVSGEPEDEAQESVAAAGKVITSSTIMVQWESVNGPISGTRRFYYAQLTGSSGDDFTSIARADGDYDNANAILTVIPQFNWSRHRVAHHAEFLGAIGHAVPIEGFTPGGHMWVYPLKSEVDHPGILRCRVPLGRSGYLHMGGMPDDPVWDGATVMGYRVILRLVTANPGADYTFVAGLGEDISQLTGENTPSTQFGTDGLWVATTSGGVWRRVRRVASTSTGNNTAVNHTAGSWFELTALRTGNTGELFINGTSALTISITSVTALLNFGFGVIDNAGGASDFIFDIDSATVYTAQLGQRWT
jgi:hypothetical protein